MSSIQHRPRQPKVRMALLTIRIAIPPVFQGFQSPYSISTLILKREKSTNFLARSAMGSDAGGQKCRNRV